GQTVLSMRALQLYAPKVQQPGYEKAIGLAAQWIAKAQPKSNEDRFWQLIGLGWAGKDKNAIRAAVKEVLAMQHSDGGWSDLPSTESNAYATGRALFALRNAGVSPSN